ncbi:hypothetical protein RhiirA5_444755 [Rhizophagus irregularis]|uniref:Uncharacterized protein n=1 Tax=Rhizophagus irregularis TaxID=588596 RepID=A0A2N0NCX9_9GLOM|nr:hypothetical protein RhiirA5_444755 [Rhizophagus irregularis]
MLLYLMFCLTSNFQLNLPSPQKYFDAASTTIFFHCFWHIASLSPSAPLFIPTSSTQEEIDDLKNNRVVIESKLDQLTGHIKQFISSIGDAPLEQTDSVSSV